MNKKRTHIVISLICLVIYISAMSSGPVGSGGGQLNTNSLPATGNCAAFPQSLQIIEDAAFYGTSLEIVVFYNELLYIGSQSFTNANVLTNVYIPESTMYIGEEAFSNGVLVHGVTGSYAQKWTAEYGYDFIAEDIWNAQVPCNELYLNRLPIVLCMILPADIGLLTWVRRRMEEFQKSMRPQDRPELNPIDYRFP